MKEPSDLIFATEVAEILNVSVRTVNRLATTGKLPVAIRGRGRTSAMLFNRADADRLAAERQAAA